MMQLLFIEKMSYLEACYLQILAGDIFRGQDAFLGTISVPSCLKHRLFNELASGQNVN